MEARPPPPTETRLREPQSLVLLANDYITACKS